MPSAEMQKDGTFMISNLFLNSHTLPNNYMWGREGIDRYNTFSYGISYKLNVSQTVRDILRMHAIQSN